MKMRAVVIKIKGDNHPEVEHIEEMITDAIWEKLANEGAEHVLDDNEEPQGITKLWSTTIEVT